MTEQLSIVPHPTYTLNPKLETIQLFPVIGLDTETTGLLPWRDTIRLIALKTGEERYLIQPEYYNKQELYRFFSRISQECLTVCHNAKFDSGFVYCMTGVLLTNLWCTLLGSQILQGGLRKMKHGLTECLSRYLHIDAGTHEEKKKNQRSFTSGSEISEAQFAYAIGDVEHLLPMRDRLIELLAERDLQKIVLLEMKLIPIIVEMEARGCLVDVVAWQNKLKEWRVKHKQILAELDAEFMRLYPYTLFANINYSSPKQIIDLFKKIGLPAPIKKERGRGEEEDTEKESVDEDTLNNYVNENSASPILHFVKLLLDYREYDKLLSTYGDSFLANLGLDNHIHTTYSQCTTTTGRFSSSGPNLQNIPSGKSGAGFIIRNYFIAEAGYRLITCDMTGAEITIAADLSKDPLLLRATQEDMDMHSHLATLSFSTIFGQRVKIEKSKEPIVIKGHTLIPEDCRDLHKSVTFSKFYKGGPARVYQVLARYINMVYPAKMRMRIAKQISEQLDGALSRLSRFLSGLIDQANAQGYLVTTKLGRRRYFDTKIYGEGANAPIQGSNADAMKIAMINIHKFVKPLGGYLVLTVHDELVCMLPQALADDVAKRVQQTMADALTAVLYELKGKATVKVAKYWDK